MNPGACQERGCRLEAPTQSSLPTSRMCDGGCPGCCRGIDSTTSGPQWANTGEKPVAAKPTTAPLSPEVADRLLDLLSTDDAFRDLFQAEPLSALRSIGYQSPLPGKMTACGLAPAAELE